MASNELILSFDTSNQKYIVSPAYSCISMNLHSPSSTLELQCCISLVSLSVVSSTGFNLTIVISSPFSENHMSNYDHYGGLRKRFGKMGSPCPSAFSLVLLKLLIIDQCISKLGTCPACCMSCRSAVAFCRLLLLQ